MGEIADRRMKRPPSTRQMGRRRKPREESRPYPFRGAHMNSHVSKEMIAARPRNATGSHHRERSLAQNAPSARRAPGWSRSGAYSTGVARIRQENNTSPEAWARPAR